MDGRLKDLIVSEAEKLEWRVLISENCWEFQKYSPAGEDFWFGVTGSDVVEEVLEYYETFDTEDHVMGLMEAKRNGFSGVPSLKELVEDADAIKEMIGELYEALHNAEVRRRGEMEKTKEGAEVTCKFDVFLLDVYQDEGGWIENERHYLGTTELKVANGMDPLEEDILGAILRFSYRDTSGREVAALKADDRRVVYVEDYYGDGSWWEIGTAEEKMPIYGMKAVEDDEEE